MKKTSALARFQNAVRQAVQTQMRLQQAYVDRYELTGQETAAAARALRWRGDRLVGCELPRT